MDKCTWKRTAYSPIAGTIIEVWLTACGKLPSTVGETWEDKMQECPYCHKKIELVRPDDDSRP